MKQLKECFINESNNKFYAEDYYTKKGREVRYDVLKTPEDVAYCILDAMKTSDCMDVICNTILGGNFMPSDFDDNDEFKEALYSVIGKAIVDTVYDEYDY